MTKCNLFVILIIRKSVNFCWQRVGTEQGRVLKMNDKNLVPFGKNPERDREIQRKGQQAQAEKKRQRRTLKEDLLALLSTEKDGKTLQEAMVVAILKQALNGSVKAYTAIEASIGEKPVEKVENTISSENKQAVDDFLKEVKNGKSKDT